MSDHRPGYLELTDHGVPVWAWVRGVPVDPEAERQLRNVAALPFVHHHVAAMPDVHPGMGATIGAVIATRGAIIPAAVGVDIGCGMMALRTDIPAARLPDDLAPLRGDIERAVPHGGFKRGGWGDHIPDRVATLWRDSGLAGGLAALEARHPKLAGANSLTHLGTLGGGNHFVEVCLDEDERVWVMLHSGSRGIGNRIGTHFIALAVKGIEHRDLGFHLPDRDLAFLEEGADPLFHDYLEAVHWAQSFAQANRRVMMERILDVLRRHLPAFRTDRAAVDCHHNYVARERHFGADVWVTRKGAVHAGKGELGVIPGSMGARSYIVRGRGNPDSFQSCSHGAGRVMSRHEARRRFTVADHRRATAGVECRKDRQVVDETPMAYKDIDAVMAAQEDLVEVVHRLRQVVCVKG